MVKISRALMRMSGFELDYDFALSVEKFRAKNELSYRKLYAAALREYIEKREGPIVDILPKLGTYTEEV